MRSVLAPSFCAAALAVSYTPYKEIDAIRFVQYARAAFCHSSAIESWNCGEICNVAPIHNGTKARYFGPGPKSKVQGYVAVLPESDDVVRCIAAFRGSVNLANWMADAQLWLASFPRERTRWCVNCRVHHGFAVAYAELQSMFHDGVRSLGCQSVQITAHSLGSAVATLATIDLRGTTDVDVPPPMLFGAPRVGDAAFARAFESLSGVESPSAWRVIHHYDPVARIGGRNIGFRHVGREVYYSTENSASYRVCSAQTSEDASCASSVSLWACLFSPYLADHLAYLNVTFRGRTFPSGCMTHSNAEPVLV